MRVAAIVVAWDSADELPGCLAALERLDHDDLEVVVVDNASRDATPQLLADAVDAVAAGARDHPLRVITNTSNRGFCGGVNDAIGVLDDDVEAVLLVNPDARPAPDLVACCVAVLESDRRIGSVQPKLRRAVPAPDGRPVLDGTGHVLTRARLWHNRGEGEVDRGQWDRPGEVFGVSGALALHRRAMLDDVAWRHPDGRREVMTEDLVAYFDDVELDWRARCRGWTARYEPAAVGVHGRAGAARRRSHRLEALNFSNRLLVLVTCDDVRALAPMAPLVVVTTVLKAAELALSHPRAVPVVLRRARLVRGALARRRQLEARASVPSRDVLDRFVEPFRWRAWVGTWWRRVTGRALGRR